MYAYFPPRLSNYAPAGMPYLAGLGLVASSVNKLTYQQDHDNWLVEQAAYVKAMLAWKAKVLALKTKYNAAVATYKKKLAAWNADYQTYLSDMDTYNTQYAGIKRDNTTLSLAIAKAYNLPLSRAYYDGGACITQEEHDFHARGCSAGGVRGLGATTSNAECGYAKLPICNFPTQPSIRPQPTAPAAPTYPAQPTLRAEPQPPTTKAPPGYAKVPPPAVVAPPAATPPSSGGGGAPAPSPDVTPDAVAPEQAPPPKQAGMLVNGLLVVAVLAGGYLVYRTVRKPKAA